LNQIHGILKSDETPPIRENDSANLVDPALLAIGERLARIYDRISHLNYRLAQAHDSTRKIAPQTSLPSELSQGLTDDSLTADHAAKRRILGIVCLNLRWGDVGLCPVWRKPFDVLGEGLVSKEKLGRLARLQTTRRRIRHGFSPSVA